MLVTEWCEGNSTTYNGCSVLVNCTCWGLSPPAEHCGIPAGWAQSLSAAHLQEVLREQFIMSLYIPAVMICAENIPFTWINFSTSLLLFLRAKEREKWWEQSRDSFRIDFVPALPFWLSQVSSEVLDSCGSPGSWTSGGWLVSSPTASPTSPWLAWGSRRRIRSSLFETIKENWY